RLGAPPAPTALGFVGRAARPSVEEAPRARRVLQAEDTVPRRPLTALAPRVSRLASRARARARDRDRDRDRDCDRSRSRSRSRKTITITTTTTTTITTTITITITSAVSGRLGTVDGV